MSMGWVRSGAYIVSGEGSCQGFTYCQGGSCHGCTYCHVEGSCQGGK